MRISKNELQLGSSGKQLMLPSPCSVKAGGNSGQNQRDLLGLRSEPDTEIDYSPPRRRFFPPAATYLAQLSLQYDATDQRRADRLDRRRRAARSYQRSANPDRHPLAGSHIQRVA